MEKKHVLLIGDHVPYVRYAKDLGLDVTLFQSPERFHLIDPSLCESVHIVNFNETVLAVKLAETIHSTAPFDAIWTFTEQAVEITSLVAGELNFPRIPYETVQLAQDKSKFRKCLNDHGLSTVAFMQSDRMDEIRRFCMEVGYPVVAKPVDGAGSKNVFIIENERELEYVFQEHNQFSRYIVEEYLDGPEISVEFISFDGVHYPLVITDKMVIPKRCVEIGHTIPSKFSSKLSLKQEIFHLVKQMLDLIGFRTGPSHTEIKLTSKGPKIIEVNIRPAGDFIPYMIKKALGYDVFSETLKYLTGQPHSVPHLQQGAAAVRYFQFPAGICEEITGVDEVRQDPNLIWLEFNLKPGDMIPDAVDTYTRSGCVVVKGETAEQAAAHVEQLMRKIRVEVRSWDENKKNV